MAALAFTLAVPQFIKPIYRMRLSARGIRIRHIYFLAFIGAALALIGNLLPSLYLNRNLSITYPIWWELAGSFLFALAYGLLAFGSVFPLKAKSRNIINFTHSVAHFLTNAQPSDHIEFAEMELEQNFIKLIKISKFIEWYEEPSAFFLFTHRKKIENSEHAASLLRIISDPGLCKTIIERTPWLVADLIRRLSKERLHSEYAARFVQEIALQAIQSDKSMLEREAGYGGFSTAPFLSRALFGDAFITRTYHPLTWLRLGGPNVLSQSFILRLNMASKLMIRASLDGKDYWQPQAHYDVASLYVDIFRDARREWRDNNVSIDALVKLSIGIKNLFHEVRSALAELPAARRATLYHNESEHWGGNLVEVYADLAYKVLEVISNGFSDSDDDFWSYAIDFWVSVFPFEPDERAGMDPFQQRLALHLQKKLRENMNGLYPAIVRLMLSIHGPHGRSEQITKRTAYVIIGDVLYDVLRSGLPTLNNKSPHNILNFLPPAVNYDPENNTLTHRFTDGSEQVTQLDSLILGSVDLNNSEIRW